MAPITVDGLDIDDATIDGDVVDEITMDGDVVFQASTIPDSGLVQDHNALAQDFDDGETIPTLEDQVGNNNLSAEESPTGVSEGINGRQAIELTDSDRFTGDGPDYSGSFTTAAVVELKSLSEELMIALLTGTVEDTDGGWRFKPRGDESPSTWEFTSNGVTAHKGTQDPLDSPAVLVQSYNEDDNTHVLDVNGQEIINTTENSWVENYSKLTVGSRDGDAGQSNHLLGRLLLYNEFYDDDGRSEIYDALANEWGF